ncbi:Beta-cyclopiazonate dehydrogenase [Fusarium austroafricanum]|uniref:Beta-cyclopiazonate dehydrogenase n=1 Tax=Fusarium austroafricanum TaxID=2364996 RepID=A0A8H4KNX9_9HYPO|nr:Beta-cyclopiazonate dehydrogenase [Fusarium austroafricanum]
MKHSPIHWLTAVLPIAACADQFRADSYAAKDVITRDVAVIGGGNSGTYGAIRLKDLGQSVVVIEKQALLGGHIDTYTDPASGTKIDFGVQTWFNYTVVRDFFARFKIPLSLYELTAGTPIYADFKTGKKYSDFKPSLAFDAYASQLAKYPYLGNSYDLPNPVPEDLLLPFGEFLAKYDLGDIAWTIWANSWGAGDALKQPTIYMLKAIDLEFLNTLVEGGVTSARRDNQEIFDKALKELGPNGLVSSTVIAAQRPTKEGNTKTKLVVKTPTGNKLVIVSKILISAPPTIENLGPLGLDKTEKSLFGQFTSSSFYCHLISDTGLPTGYSFQNVLPTSKATYSIPSLPGLYNINPTAVKGIYSVWYGGTKPLSQDDVKKDITATVKRLRKTAKGSTDGKVSFIDFSSHTPFQLAVPSDAIADGFYRELSALQGHRNTWYTGSAFVGNHAALLWNFTETLLPKVIGK